MNDFKLNPDPTLGAAFMAKILPHNEKNYKF